MARPTWKGNINFGLVNIPVSLYPGEQRSDLSFRMLDSRNNARVRYERVNEITGEEVPWDKIVKAFEFSDDNYVLLTEEDFERAAIEATQSVDIEDFVELSDIPIPHFERPYILVPAKAGRKAYVLLREALRKTNRVGIAKVVIRTRQYLAAVLPQKDALILCLLRFANELRDTADYDIPTGALDKYKISDKEVNMAMQLIESMASAWNAEQYTDEYSKALHDWIQKKAEADGEMPAAEPVEEEKPAGEIIDIMDLLKKSMQKDRNGARTTTEAKGKSSAGRASASGDKAPAKAKPKAAAKPKTKSTSAAKTRAKAAPARRKAS